MMKPWCVIGVILLVVFAALPATAFTPDDEELTGALKKHFGPLRSWEAKMTFPEHSGVEVHVWYSRGKWRQEWQAGDTAAAVGLNGNMTTACTPGSFALSPLFVWMPPNPLETWKQWGVAVDVRNYGFCSEQPCFMLGAEPGDDASPAVRLNNEDLTPLLVRYVTGAGLTSVEFLDHKTVAGYSVPQKIVVIVAGTSLEVAVKWIAINGADSEDIYVKESLSPIPCAEPPAPFDFLRNSFRYPSSQ
ncbi:hypothetical protein [uncultured Pseudodesulfovibrio sp.]|uniref:hypothetical protein n=1 Tax=uncultured Pseudodesulfovibrio sp. TaxID=2035858 RepID=UPI0029C8A215|nr:hypothetical protein [uncultured Pseudodesulfovibrio sp.]